MRKILFVAAALLASSVFTGAGAAVKSKKKAKAKAQPVVEKVVLTTSSDSLSYVAGMAFTQGLASYLKSQGVDSTCMADFLQGFKEQMKAGNDPRLNARFVGIQIASQVKQMLPNMKKEFTDTPDSLIDTLVFRGFYDALINDTTHYKQNVAEAEFMAKRTANKKMKSEKLYGPNRDAGEKFLAENAKKDSVVVLPSGLQYKVLVKGDGPVPARTDKVLVNYEGKLIDGTVFDSSSKHGSNPATFRPDQVIKGWTEALTMMPVGSKWQLFIPYTLAYGERQAGQLIQPYSALVFTVELVGIDNPEAKAAADEAKKQDKPIKAKKIKKAKSKK